MKDPASAVVICTTIGILVLTAILLTPRCATACRPAGEVLALTPVSITEIRHTDNIAVDIDPSEYSLYDVSVRAELRGELTLRARDSDGDEFHALYWRQPS